MCALKFWPLVFLLNRQVLGKPPNMDIIRPFQNISWCKPDWCFPSMSKETNELLRQCTDLPKLELTDDVDELIKRSKAFPIPFPIETVRLEQLKTRIPIETLKRNIVSTYPVIHERVLLLMTHFLIYKREFGTSIEKALYKDMTVLEFIDRLLTKRAVVFMNAQDNYRLITGEEGTDGWEAVGTLQQKPPLVLQRCLSYDELKLSALIAVSGSTVCINDGARRNAGVVDEEGAETEAIIIVLQRCLSYDELKLSALIAVSGSTVCINDGARRNAGVVDEEGAETEAIIIGTVGARFERKYRMDYEDMLITEQQNCPGNGYGEEVTPTTCLNVLKTTYVRNNQSARHMWRQMWSEFYQVHSYTYEELLCYITLQEKTEEQKYTDRYVPLGDAVFDNEVYYKRISVLAETALLEASSRGEERQKPAYLNVIGCGLGVWKISPHQTDVYVLTFLERIRSLLKKDLLRHVSDVNFAYIKPSDGIRNLFTGDESSIFLESKRHPFGGINVSLLDRSPSSRLSGADKLLVMLYPADGGALPGNEFWTGSLTGSGDPAAACSTQIAELHNAHINPAVSASHARIAGKGGLHTISEYCAARVT